MNSPNSVENTQEIAEVSAAVVDDAVLSTDLSRQLVQDGYDWLVESSRAQEVLACMLEPDLINRGGVDGHTPGDLSRSRLHVLRERDVTEGLRVLENRKWIEKRGNYFRLTSAVKRELKKNEALVGLVEQVTASLQNERDRLQEMTPAFRTKLILDTNSGWEPYLRAICIVEEDDPSQLISNRLMGKINIKLKPLQGFQNKLRSLGLVQGDNIPTDATRAWYREYCVDKTLPDFSKTSKKASTQKKTTGRFHSHAAFPDSIGKLLRDDLLGEVVALFHYAKEFGVAKRLAKCTRTELAAELPDVLTPHLAALIVTGLDELGVVKDISRTHFRYEPSVVTDFVDVHPRSRQRLQAAKERLSKRFADFRELSTEEQVEYMLKNQGTARAVLDKAVAYQLAHKKPIDQSTLADSLEISAGNVKRQVSLLSSLRLIDKKLRPLPHAQAWYKRFVDPNANVETKNVLDTGIVETPARDIPQELARPQTPVVVEAEPPKEPVEEASVTPDFSAPEALADLRDPEDAIVEEAKEEALRQEDEFDINKAIVALRDNKVAEFLALIAHPTSTSRFLGELKKKPILARRPHAYRAKDFSDLLKVLRQAGFVASKHQGHTLLPDRIELLMQSSEGRHLLEEGRRRLEADDRRFQSLTDSERINEICEIHTKYSDLLKWLVDNPGRVSTKAGEKEVVAHIRTSMFQLPTHLEFLQSVDLLNQDKEPTAIVYAWYEEQKKPAGTAALVEQSDTEPTPQDEGKKEVPVVESPQPLTVTEDPSREEEKEEAVEEPEVPEVVVSEPEPQILLAADVRKKIAKELRQVFLLGGLQENEISIVGDTVTIQPRRLHKNIRRLFETYQEMRDQNFGRKISARHVPLKKLVLPAHRESVQRLVEAFRSVDFVDAQGAFWQKPEIVNYLSRLEQLGRMERALVASDDWRSDRHAHYNQRLSSAFVGSYASDRSTVSQPNTPLSAIGDLIQGVNESTREDFFTAFFLHNLQADTLADKQIRRGQELLQIVDTLGLPIVGGVGKIPDPAPQAYSQSSFTLDLLKKGLPIDIFADKSLYIYPEISEETGVLRIARIEMKGIEVVDKLFDGLKRWYELNERLAPSLVDDALRRSSSQDVSKVPYDGFASNVDFLQPYLSSFTISDGVVDARNRIGAATYSFRMTRTDNRAVWYPSSFLLHDPGRRHVAKKHILHELEKVHKLNIEVLDRLRSRIKPVTIAVTYPEQLQEEDYSAVDVLNDVARVVTKNKGRVHLKGEHIAEVARLLDNGIAPSLLRSFVRSTKPQRRIAAKLRAVELYGLFEKSLFEENVAAEFNLRDIEIDYHGGIVLRGQLPYAVEGEAMEDAESRTHSYHILEESEILSARHHSRARILKELVKDGFELDVLAYSNVDVTSPEVQTYVYYVAQLESDLASGRLSQFDLTRAKKACLENSAIGSTLRKGIRRDKLRDLSQLSSFHFEVVDVARRVFGPNLRAKEIKRVAKLVRAMRFLDIPRHLVTRLDKVYRYPMPKMDQDRPLGTPYRYSNSITTPIDSNEIQIVTSNAPKQVDFKMAIKPQKYLIEVRWGSEENSLFPRVGGIKVAPDFSVYNLIQELQAIHRGQYTLSQERHYDVPRATQRHYKALEDDARVTLRDNDALAADFHQKRFLGGRQFVAHPESALFETDTEGAGEWYMELQQGQFTPLVNVLRIAVRPGLTGETKERSERQLRLHLEGIMQANDQLVRTANLASDIDHDRRR